MLSEIGDLTRLREGTELLRRHLWIEEEVLFDAVARMSLALPSYIMQYEHAQMWLLLEELAATCEADTAPTKLHEPCRTLARLLEMYNYEAEAIIYATVDRRAATEVFVTYRALAAREAAVPASWGRRGRRAGFAPPSSTAPSAPDCRVVQPVHD